LDLRVRPADIPADVYVCHFLKNLLPGEEAIMLTAEDPENLLGQIRRQLQSVLKWRVEGLGKSQWRVRIKSRENSEETTLGAILTRDHECLERLFVQARQLVGEGRVQQARPFVRLFIEGLKRHIQVEDDVLVPVFPVRSGAANDDARTMQREHEDILQQIEAIEGRFRMTAPDPFVVDALFRQLTATLAKHEHWEETVVYPKWDDYLRDNDDGRVLFDRLTSILAIAPHNLALQTLTLA
jgi:hemerythrin superfamily protein